MTTLRLVKHSTRNVSIVEILEDGEVVGVIYPNSPANGIRVISAHIAETVEDNDFAGEVTVDDGSSSIIPIPCVTITFSRSPYIITPQGIWRI